METIKNPADTGQRQGNEQAKDNKYLTQFRIIRGYFYHNTASRYMAAIATGVPLQSVCRYVEMLQKSDQVAIVKYDRCEISGLKVQFLTTNPAKFPANKQYQLF